MVEKGRYGMMVSLAVDRWAAGAVGGSSKVIR